MANQVLYGFTNLKDVFTDRVETVGIPTVNTAIDATIAEHNRQMDALMALFAQPTTEYQIRYKTPQAARLQPLDESGRARPIKALGHYDVAFPLQDAGVAWGQTYKASRKMTVQEANNILNTVLTADRRWMRDHVLAALYANASWTFTDDEHGSLTVKGLANSDTDKYLIQTGSDAGTTDTHYLAQAAAISDAADPFSTIYTELTEHPENSGDVIALIPTNLKTSVETLSGFYPTQDGNLRYGNAATLLQRQPDLALPGTLLGYHEAKVYIVEWKSLPDNYIVSVMTGGDRPLAMREEAEASLRGFNRVADRNDHPFYESQYLRIAGFGAMNRVGALVYRVSNGAYAVPTGYDSPMA